MSNNGTTTPDTLATADAPVALSERQQRRIRAGAEQTVAASRADRLSDSDLTELTEVAASVERAQHAFVQTQQQAMQAVQERRDEAIGAEQVHAYVLGRIRQRYAVMPTDVIHPDGAIVRNPPVASDPQDS